MTNEKDKTMRFLCILVLTLFGSTAASSEELDSHDTGPGGEEHHYKNHFGFSAGPAFHGGETAAFLGLDYIRRFGSLVGVGVYVESVRGEFDLEGGGVVVGLWPGAGWKVAVGAGVERKLGKNETKRLVSVNAGYDFHGKRWSIGPLLAIDFVEDNSEVIYLGAAFGFGF